jgi:hypothetical protein
MNAIATGTVDKGADFGSSQVHQMKAQKVAMLTGEGVNAYAAGEIWSFFDKELDYKLSLFNASDFSRLKWDDIDVLILPDGKYRFLDNKESAIEFKNWIQNGDSSSKQGSEKKQDPYSALKVFANRQRDDLSDNTRGSIYKVDVDNTHPLMFGYPDHYYTLKMDSVVYEFIKKDGWNVGVVKKENLMAGYVGYKLAPKLKDGLLFGVQNLGKGSVTYLTDDGMFRDFWQNGKLMMVNAVFMVGE